MRKGALKWNYSQEMLRKEACFHGVPFLWGLEGSLIFGVRGVDAPRHFWTVQTKGMPSGEFLTPSIGQESRPSSKMLAMVFRRVPSGILPRGTATSTRQGSWLGSCRKTRPVVRTLTPLRTAREN